MSAAEHKVTLTAEDGYGVEWRFVCGYDPDDTSRPCWPREDDGTRTPGATFCNWQAWWENDDEQPPVASMPSLSFVVDGCFDEDHYVFDLAAPTVEENDGK